jgi:AraC-like DNA-binding protein
MVDLDSGDFTQLLRAPDIRFSGLRHDSWRFDRPFHRDIQDAARAYFYHVKRGAAWFRTGPGADELHYISAGASVGVEGHAHEWFDSTKLHVSEMRKRGVPGVSDDELPVEIFSGSIDRSLAVLQRLPHGAIIIPADAKPYAQMMAGCASLTELELSQPAPDGAVIRRLSEIVMLQLVAFARNRLLHGLADNPRLAHDEFLVRAMTAFFAEPNGRWTVARLAAAAGLSGPAFAERFKRTFGNTPRGAINRLRLNLSQDMLRQSAAPLGEIAAQIGFGSAAAYVRAFKREFGEPPRAWRERQRRGTVTSLPQGLTKTEAAGP